MKDNYDFSKGIKNPYAKKLKKQITIRIDAEVIEYFKEQATDVGISYQNLINLETFVIMGKISYSHNKSSLVVV